MTYTKQTWNNDDPTTPVSAARLSYLESGLLAAHSPMTARPFPLLGRVNHGGYTSPNGLTEAQEGAKYGIFVFNSNVGDQTHIAGMKSGNPNIKIFDYLDMGVIDTTDTTGISSGVGYTLANNGSNEAFFTHHGGSDSSHRVHNGGTGYVANVGNSSYQQACISNILTQLATGAWDGVYMDEVDTNFNFYSPSPSGFPDEYANNAAWIVAWRSFLDAVVPAIRAKGYMVILNLADDYGVVGSSEHLIAPCDGVFMESWTDGGAGLAQQDAYWHSKLSTIAWCEQNKKLCFLNSYNTTEAGKTYALGGMLLVASYDGYCYFGTAPSGAYTTEVFIQEYTDAANLGPPVAPYVEVQYRVYMRRFRNGVVLVNASSATSNTIQLGTTSSAVGNTHVTSTTVPARSAYIFLYDSF